MFALGERQHVTSTPAPNGLALAVRGSAAPLVVDASDWQGVQRAVNTFASDVHAVTGLTPAVLNRVAGRRDLVLVGTIGRSLLLDKLVVERRIDVSDIRGRWEMFVMQIVTNPFPGVSRALVIAGSDERGTIFGVYDLSEQIGVSPWYWWADVPIAHKSELWVAAGRYVQPEPGVKYRGIFLNDEAPSLSGWVAEKFGGFNHKFYEHVFELLLRLKANFL